MLCIAEKHSVAKQLAIVLSDNAYTQTSIDKYTHAYTFTMTLQNVQQQMIITHGAGHAKNYEFTQNKLDSREFFKAPIHSKVTQYGTGLFKTIKKYINTATSLVLCQDNDREGEHIAWEAVEVASDSRKINIFPSVLPVVRTDYQKNIISEPSGGLSAKRARFSSLTKTELVNAFSNLSPLNTGTIEAVDIRQQLDLRIGYALSSLQNKNAGKLNSRMDEVARNSKKPRYTFGTCQIPTLGLCYLKNHKNFSEDCKLSLKSAIPQQLESKPLPLLIGYEESVKCQAQLKQSPYVQITCTSSDTTQHPPPPPNTIELQKYLKNINASTVMKTAETLYQKGLISYPRTETRQFTNDMNNTKLTQNLINGTYNNYVQKLINNNQFKSNLSRIESNNKSKKLQNDESHPPIHPLKCVSLTGLEQTVFDAICRLYLASVSFDCIRTKHEYTTKVGQLEFKATQTYIKEPGFTEILHDQKKEDIPDFKEAQKVEVQNLTLNNIEHTACDEKMTQLKLIEKMDQYGIGTDATIAEHIDNVQNRGYVNQKMQVEAAGKVISELYQRVNYNFIATTFRAMTEAGLREICEGKRKAVTVYKDVIELSMKLFDDVNYNLSSMQ
ncbi:DNA_topoisomerase [Hexamita inflata]|uniref:DNA topoisomerase n=1 Tax=Hexamita inflata TaxID=28002 RepID=A0AA86T948_9EUKA|nr:DNA topoisomerase [Hexamita inflata]